MSCAFICLKFGGCRADTFENTTQQVRTGNFF